MCFATRVRFGSGFCRTPSKTLCPGSSKERPDRIDWGLAVDGIRRTRTITAPITSDPRAYYRVSPDVINDSLRSHCSVLMRGNRFRVDTSGVPFSSGLFLFQREAMWMVPGSRNEGMRWGRYQCKEDKSINPWVHTSDL